MDSVGNVLHAQLVTCSGASEDSSGSFVEHSQSFWLILGWESFR